MCIRDRHWPCVVTTKTCCTVLVLLQPKHVALALRCYKQNTLHWPCVVTTKTCCTGLALLQPKHVALALRCYNQNMSHWPCVVTTKTCCTGLALLQPKHVCIKEEPNRRRKLPWKMERMCKYSIHLQVSYFIYYISLFYFIFKKI